MCVIALVHPVTLTRLLALVNARSSHSLLYCVRMYVCVCMCACVSISVCISISVCGHMSRKAVAWPHRFHALFSHLFTSPLRLTSLLPVLLHLFGPLPMAMVHLGNQQLSRK